MGSRGRAIQAYLGEMTGRSTVPNVFIAAESVGGGDEVQSYANSGALKKMLTDAFAQSASRPAADTPSDASHDAYDNALEDDSAPPGIVAAESPSLQQA